MNKFYPIHKPGFFHDMLQDAGESAGTLSPFSFSKPTPCPTDLILMVFRMIIDRSMLMEITHLMHPVMKRSVS